MSKRISKAVTLLALSVLSTLALADAPARVGRIALAEGKVDISAQVGDETNAALLNWPVTSENQVTTAPGARTEIRVGSTAIRLDGDSALEVIELDDETLRLHLHYGSASIRVRNPEVLAGLEISTPQGRVRMQEPGRLRIDAERRDDTSTVSVFDGVALVDGGGSTLTIRANRRAELRGDDIITGMAQRDAFDDWAMTRDRRDERIASERYVGSEMTGYEDLDAYGSWRDDAEYGPLWTPRHVSSDWAPYRDGRWTYMSTWGWTWVDNAPWGYAPFHYGRWVMVNQRWCWAPGRNIGRPVWSPALVGWVGGAGWNVNFRSGGGYRHAPGQGWYPLAPRDTYAPHYRVKPDHLRYLNRHAQDRNEREQRMARRHDGRDGRNDLHQRGLTVVPHDHFGRRNQIVVPAIARASVAPQLVRQAPRAAPPQPFGAQREITLSGPEHEGMRGQSRHGGERDERGERGERNWRGAGEGRPRHAEQPRAIQSPPQQQAIMQGPQPLQTAQPQTDARYEAMMDARRREEARSQWRASRDARYNAPVMNAPAQPQRPIQTQPQPQIQPQIASQAPGQAWGMGARAAMGSQRDDRAAAMAAERNERAAAMAAQRMERERQGMSNDFERRAAPVYSAQRQNAPMPMAQPQPQPQPIQRAAPPPMALPQPVQAAPAPQPQRQQHASQRDEGPRDSRPGRHQMMR